MSHYIEPGVVIEWHKGEIIVTALVGGKEYAEDIIYIEELDMLVNRLKCEAAERYKADDDKQPVKTVRAYLYETGYQAFDKPEGYDGLSAAYTIVIDGARRYALIGGKEMPTNRVNQMFLNTEYDEASMVVSRTVDALLPRDVHTLLKPTLEATKAACREKIDDAIYKLNAARELAK